MNLIKTYNLEKTKQEVVNEMQYVLFLASNSSDVEDKDDVIETAVKVADLNIDLAAILNEQNRAEIVPMINENYQHLNKLMKLKEVEEMVSKRIDAYEKWLLEFLNSTIKQ